MEKTLRDEIAIAAMQGMIISSKYEFADQAIMIKVAYNLADMMLEARKEKDNA